MSKEFVFLSDYIEILTCEYDTMIFTPVYSEEAGLYLGMEDEKPIKCITLLNSNLIIDYLNGQTKLIDIPVISVTIQDSHFIRRVNRSFVQTLFRYSANDAQKYELDIEKAFDYKTVEVKTRKRSI